MVETTTREALIARLKNCCATMTNDDTSAPGTEKRERQVERVDTILATIEYLEQADDVLRLMAALQPFAIRAANYDFETSKDSHHAAVTVGELRAARAAISETA